MSLHDHRFAADAAAATATGDAPRERLWPAIVTCWLFACVILTVTCWRAIERSIYPDPDDILRMLEVRDLLGGQSWWDVSQHRFASGLMHWSRLVDLPLAATELVARPFLSARGAELVALVVVPLITLGVVMALVAAITRRLLDAERARATLLLAPLSVPLIYQMRPMRIDHHGWQVALAVGALLAFLDRRPGWRSGAIGGLCLATLLTISLEGLPITAALLALVALGWVFDPSRRAQLNGATGVAFASALLLHLVTRGPAFWSPACDAMAPVWLAILGVAAGGTALVTRLPLARSGYPGLALRLGAMAVVGGASGAALLLVDPRCTAGPFQALPPIVHDLWYEIVSEGLPVWDQLPVWAALCVGMPIVGLIGSAMALREAEGERRAAWWLMIGAQVAAFGLSLLVSRSAATANAMALPGAALVMIALLTRARRIRYLLPRVLATAGTLVLVTPGVAALAFLGPPTAQWAAEYQASRARHPRPPCSSADDPRALGALPPARLFAPIDIAPEIVAATPHRAITSGHHRNALAMADVLETFTGSPAHAEATVRHYRADYVVGCPGFSETSLYDSVAPHGFWARLERGERFSWLTPVRIPGSPVLAWRVHPLPEHAPRP